MRHSRIISLFILTIILSMVLAGRTTVSAQTPGFLSVNGTWITDAIGSPILLRGVNYPGYTYQSLGFHKESDYANFAQMGFNAVRLQISWAKFEPSNGHFDSSLLW